MRHMNVVARAGLQVAEIVALKSIPQGAATQCYVAVHPATAAVSGEFFADCNVARAERLWTFTEEIVAKL